MTPSVPNPAQPGERATLGRLSGLSAREADRGERALWLSGEGHRAALFHLGALTRLNELGLLAGMGTIGASAGGSIAAAVLATRVRWPLRGSCGEWEERVAAPLREIAGEALEEGRSGQRRRPFPGAAGEAALEERFARELLSSAGERESRGPRFVFGASGLALSGIGAAGEHSLEWDLEGDAEDGYDPDLVAETIAGLHTGLGGFEEAGRAALENHGYLLADAAAREQGIGPTAAEGVPANAGGRFKPDARVPHPEWMDAERLRAALSGAAEGRRPRRLPLRRRGGPVEKRERAG